MNTFVLTFVSLVAASGATPHGSRIIGGSEAKDGQFPHMASLRYVDPYMGDMHMCGATILNSRCIITAAHCVVGFYPDNYYVKVGTTSLTEGGTIYQVKKILPHENFEGFNITSDIALIFLQTPIKFIKNKVSPLPLNTEPLTGGEEVIFGGWGLTDLWGSPPDKLQWLKTKVISQKSCIQRQKPFVVDDGMICTFVAKNIGACKGDSGSFLMYKGKLVGIVSWGRPCALGYPDVFTRILHFVGWIQQNMKQWN